MHRLCSFANEEGHIKNECTLPSVNVCRQAILHLHLITLLILLLTQSLQLTYNSFLQHRSFVCLYDYFTSSKLIGKCSAIGIHTPTTNSVTEPVLGPNNMSWVWVFLASTVVYFRTPFFRDVTPHHQVFCACHSGTSWTLRSLKMRTLVRYRWSSP